MGYVCGASGFRLPGVRARGFRLWACFKTRAAFPCSVCMVQSSLNPKPLNLKVFKLKDRGVHVHS